MYAELNIDSTKFLSCHPSNDRRFHKINNILLQRIAEAAVLCDHSSWYQMLPFEILRRTRGCGYRACYEGAISGLFTEKPYSL